jgi:Winged helix DNA-binding domain
LRAAAQLLHRPAGVHHPAEVAARICGAQAQDQRAGRLAFRCRMRGLLAADVERARVEERSLLRAPAMRGTIHLIATEDAGWLLPLFAPSIAAGSRRRLAQLGVAAADQERALASVGSLLAADGPLTRQAIAEHLEALGVRVSVQVRTHAVRLLLAEGVACQGPGLRLVHARDWLGPLPSTSRAEALAELARRYLGGFGPATESDLARWSGLALGQARSGMQSIGGELEQVRVGGGTAWTLRGRRPSARGRVVALLPAFDTCLLGHRDRGFLAQPAQWRRIAPGGGILRPVAMVDGTAAGTWGMQRSGRRLQVHVEPFTGLDADVVDALQQEAADVARFEGAPAAGFTVRSG